MGPQTAFNRRQWIGLGGAALLLSPLAAAPPEVSDAIATGTAGRNLLTVEVLLNNRGPYHFVVDTGADRTVIADSVQRDLAFPVGNAVRVQGIVRNIDTATARVANLQAGTMYREDLDFPVLPYEQLRADGYLGLDVLDGYRVSFDFRRGILRVMDPRPSQVRGPDAPREVPIRMSGTGGHLRSANCVVDGVACTAFVDTGAEVSVGNPLLLERLRLRQQVYGVTETIALTGVTGGAVDGNVVAVKTIKLGGLTFEDSRIAIADLQVFQLWGLQDRPCLFVGMNWLRRFNRVSIDYGRKELRFDLASAARDNQLRDCLPGEAACRYLLG
ncbi:MAG: aspartyl protease family protein [Rhizomicrobium sp.]|nr:aspartyl protease family protein [Rhizomicrobium sp.]